MKNYVGEDKFNTYHLRQGTGYVSGVFLYFLCLFLCKISDKKCHLVQENNLLLTRSIITKERKVKFNLRRRKRDMSRQRDGRFPFHSYL